MTARFNRGVIESLAIELLGELGYEVRDGVELFESAEGRSPLDARSSRTR